MKKTNKVHSFHESLKIGQAGESAWLDLIQLHYPEYKIEQADGRKHDFVIQSPFGPFTLELKTDSYDMDKTENFFIERYSNWEKRSPGGPYQAQSKNIDLYCYWFSTNKVMHTANVNNLIKAIDILGLTEKKLIPIMNRGFITKGYKIPRKDLHEVFTTVDFNDIKLMR